MNVKFNDEIILQEADGEFIILDTLNEEIITINSTAGFIVKKIKDGFTLEQIVVQMLEEFDQNYASVLNDLKSFVDELLIIGVLKQD